jgi:hypothetical protein
MGINIQAFGNGWSNGYLSTQKMVELFNKSKINLNFVQCYDDGRPQLKARFFEVCMAGGFLLSEYFEGIEDFFKIDKEIVCFINFEEAIEKINYYLTHENERIAIANAGYRRAQRDHTQQERFIKIFNEIEQKKKLKLELLPKKHKHYSMPDEIRKLPCFFHLSWAKGLWKEKFPNALWRKELELALLYRALGREANKIYIIFGLPKLIITFLQRLKRKHFIA